MDNFFIITNETKDIGGTITREICDILTNNGKTIVGTANGYASVNDAADSVVIPKEAECIIVLGGDGTLLRVARNTVNLGLPLLGINLGHLGYLTEGDKTSAEEIIMKVISGEYIVEKRMMLTGRIRKPDGTLVCENVALNDITINRSRSLRIFDFKMYVNGRLLYNYNADGIIVSSPTGSTAYNLSCGGPIVEPTAELFVVTPIAPHSLNNRSLILSKDDKIELELIGSAKDESQLMEYMAYFDGDAYVQLYPGDIVEIVESPAVTKILRLQTQSFLEILRNKMS